MSQTTCELFEAGSVTSAALSDGAVTAAKIGYAGAILQVVQTTLTSRISQTTSGSTEYDVITASITPSSTSSKVLLVADIKYHLGGSYNALGWYFKRNSTKIYIGDAYGSAQRFTAGGFQLDSSVSGSLGVMQYHGMYLDSPSTASSITYAITWQDGNSDAGIFYMNRGISSGTASNDLTGASSLTLMEVAG